MAYVTQAGLSWAIEQLRTWTATAPKRPTQNIVRLFVLKLLGVTTDPPAAPFTTANFRSACSRLMQVVFADDETSSFSGDPLYFNPLTCLYPSASGKSDYAVGTMWTRLQTWQKDGVTAFPEPPGQKARAIRFTANYVDALANQMKDVRIPTEPLALFFYRRPSDLGLSVDDVNSVEQLTARFLGDFSLTGDVQDRLLAPMPPPAALEVMGPNELSRTNVIELLTSLIPITISSTEEDTPEPAASTGLATIAWANVPNPYVDPCGLIGLEAPFRRAVTALQAGKNIVLIGAPGTGKTELAACICSSLAVPYDIVTATAEWSAFTTVGGYFPTLAAEGAAGAQGELLDFIPGIVTKSFQSGRWLVIDELNRADIDKAFGELFTVLGKRSIRLPYKKRDAGQVRDVVIGASTSMEPAYVIDVPSNWRLIGTMNTFDKASLFQMSFAFMRRFAFIDVPVPGAENYRKLLEQRTADLEQLANAEFRDAIMASLVALFADPQIAVLKETQVGPAIALDVVGYVTTRRRTQAPGSTLSANAVVLEALESVLYPQFEGREQTHASLLDALTAVLALDDEARAATDLRLRAWTGFKPGGDVY
jgi:5-methylcytosine-specific restriction protein B